MYLKSKSYQTGSYKEDPYLPFGPRLYLYPSYAFGQIGINLRLKLILPNEYPAASAYHYGGGLLAGIEPTWEIPLEKGLVKTIEYFKEKVS